MAGTYTNIFKNLIVDQIKEALDEENPTNIYFFIANSLPWGDESLPPQTQDTLLNDYDIRRNFLAMKKISPAETSYVVNRINWIMNTVYTMYTDDDPELYSKNFYVITDEYNVYKCIYNKNGSPSTTKPVGTSNTIVSTADGYRWKYMYTINASDAIKFVSSTFIPVRTLTSDDGSSQWPVQASAIDGAILSFDVESGGAGYLQASGIVSANNANNRMISLASDANTIDDIYIGSSIYISSGTGAGQLKTIVDYVGSTRTVITDTDFSPALNTVNSTYYVSPKVTIIGDGTNASGYSTVIGGVINEVKMLNFGTNYTQANATITANVGTSASVRPIISPFGGHGKDPVRELGSSSLMFSIQLNADEGNTVTVKNEFRTIGLISDPVLANNSIANNLIYDLTNKFNLANTTGEFFADELITGQTSGAKGYVVDYNGNTTTLRLTNITGVFSNTETITGNNSLYTAKINGIVTYPIKKYFGKVLYTENRSPIARSSNQKEIIKFVLKV